MLLRYFLYKVEIQKNSVGCSEDTADFYQCNKSSIASYLDLKSYLLGFNTETVSYQISPKVSKN